MADSDDLITLTEAATLLGVSRMKISRLLKSGELTVAGRDPLDHRTKLVWRADVEALSRRSVKNAAA